MTGAQRSVAARRRRPGWRAWLLAVALILMCGEIAARLLPDVKSPSRGLAMEHPRTGITLRPGWSDPDAGVHVNSAGFRDLEELGPKTPGERRVLLLGDSQAFGASVRDEEVLGERLEEALRPLIGEVRMVNAAVPGSALLHERLRLEEVGGQVEPDLVVLVVSIPTDHLEALVYTPEDLHNAERRSVRLVRDGRLEVVSRKAGMVRQLLRRSALVRRFESSPVNRLLKSIGRRKRSEAPAVGTVTAERFYELKRRQLAACWRGAWEVAPMDRAWQHVGSELLRLAEVTRSRQVPLIVVLVPDEMQVAPAVLEAALGTFEPPLRAEDFDVLQPQRAWISACEAAAVPVVDLLPDFLAAPDPPALFLPFDSHLSPAGHRRAAELLAPHVARLLPRP